MNYMQKLVLVPIEEWEKVKDKNSKSTHQILTVKHPQTIVNHFIQSPPQKKVQNPPQKKTQKQDVKLIKSINKLPSRYKDRGLSLLRYMKRNDDIKWNEKGEFQYQNKTIPKSDIFSLIKHAISKSKSKPKGIKTFYKVLHKLNIPNFIVVNKMGKVIKENVQKKSDDLWRPPGKLEK